ncbi:MAG: type IV pilin biogenesis protein [Gammaproteobacteria bacterium]|nr:type IV pilin biogenesis protein [Gammaproteobacteria bacterium]
MKTRTISSVWNLLGVLAALAGSAIPAVAVAALGEQPQVLVILDTSQGMAGDLSGAIMSGSGTVAADASSSSPICYPLNGYIPLSTAAPSVGGTCPAGEAAYTVTGANGVLTDNSESMINVAEQSLLAAFANPQYANVFQAGLMDYATAKTPSPYQTWVYYMSADTATASAKSYTECAAGIFGYGASTTVSSCPAEDALAVANPCYNTTGGGCSAIDTLLGAGLDTNAGLYINDTSDDPQINDVLYMSTNSGYPSNFVTYVGASPANPYTAYSLTQYEDQILTGKYLLEAYAKGTAGGKFATSPTDAGYIPYSGMVWYSQRGYAFDGAPVTNGTSGGQGNLVVPVAALSTSLSALQAAMAPEQFASGGSEIVAGSEFAPMAGTLTAALDYLTGSNGPQPACAPKFVILITDGQPTMGQNGHVYPPLGSASATGYGETWSSTAAVGSTDNDNAVTEAVNAVTALDQNGGAGGPIKTYVLGVGPGVDCTPTDTNCTAEQKAGYEVLQALAKAGATKEVYSANSQASFQQAFDAILNNIEGQVLTSNGGSSSQLTSGSYEYVLQATTRLGEGNLVAYPVLANGAVSPTPAWNVNALMAQSGSRSAALYSNGPPVTSGGTTVPGPLTLFSSLDTAAFALPASTTLTPAIVEDYTIDPSYGTNSPYLGGRGPGWYVGITTSTPPVVLTPPNDANLLANSSYASYTQAASGRPPMVLFADNDGFLYAADASNGNLLWGWMPRPLVQYLQNYQTFWQGSNMVGGFRVVDAASGSASAPTWSTYIVGLGMGGGITYALQLTDPSASTAGNPGALDTLSTETWEQDNLSATAPNSKEPVIARPSPSSGTAYMLTVLNTTVNSAVQSSLQIVDVATGQVEMVSLPFTANTEPYVDQAGNVFIGDNGGNVWEAALWTSTGALPAATAFSWTPLNSSALASYGSVATTSDGTGPLVYIGGAYYNGIEYLRVQSNDRLTILEEGANGWEPLWTSYAGGSATLSGTASSGVTPLPAGAVISDEALIANGAVILPVTEPGSNAGSTCSSPNAYYYLYALGTGLFPANAFRLQSPTGIALVTSAVDIGSGIAYTPSLAVMNGQVRLQGAAQQNTEGQAALSFDGYAGGVPAGGPLGWRRILWVP